LANPELGAKQICPNCSSKFYDLGRRPAVCPKCATEFDPEEAMRNRRVRVRAVAPEEVEDETAVKTNQLVEDGFEAEPEEDAPELDAVVDEPPLIVDEDSEESEPGQAPSPDALGVDFSEDDELAGADDDDGVPFIEDDDDAFSEDDLGIPGEPEDEV
jgi:uncharacterized protein (TIGR02300 family)